MQFDCHNCEDSGWIAHGPDEHPCTDCTSTDEPIEPVYLCEDIADQQIVWDTNTDGAGRIRIL